MGDDRMPSDILRNPLSKFPNISSLLFVVDILEEFNRQRRYYFRPAYTEKVAPEPSTTIPHHTLKARPPFQQRTAPHICSRYPNPGVTPAGHELYKTTTIKITVSFRRRTNYELPRKNNHDI